MKRIMKIYTYEEVKDILVRSEKGENPQAVAIAYDRTIGGIRTLYYNYTMFRDKRAAYSISSSMKEYFERYIRETNGNHTAEVKQQEAPIKETTKSKETNIEDSTEAFIFNLDTAMENVKEAAIGLVEHTVKTSVEKRILQVQKELDDLRLYKQETEKELETLRAFKVAAQESNFSSMLRKKLRPSFA